MKLSPRDRKARGSPIQRFGGLPLLLGGLIELSKLRLELINLTLECLFGRSFLLVRSLREHAPALLILFEQPGNLALKLFLQN